MRTRKLDSRRLGLVSAVAALTALALVLAATAWSQTDSMQTDNPAAIKGTGRAIPRMIDIGYFRPHDARGLNVFETPKVEGAPYDGFKIMWGAAFTQQFQALDHENTAVPVVVGVPPTNINQLVEIGSGFNNADANLYLDAQLAKGIRVALTSYLSSRHHNETWVKDGYLQIDGSPWENPTLDNLMKVLTLRLGHFEINYGDQHFRRSDNGQALFNPLIGNLLMDAFTTEIGGEAYLKTGPWLVMAAVTGGEVRGTVTKPEQRSPSYIGKVGWDSNVNADLRVRVTGSVYHTTESSNNTLYTGSRAGSRYYWVLENTLATETAQAWSGDVRPGFGKKVTAWVVNPFIKLRDLELFGNIEQSEGRNANETEKRKFDHYAAEGLYRLFSNQVYVAGRYNVATGTYPGMTADATVERIEVGGGWFLTQNLLAKAEWIQQKYTDFPVTDIRNGGKFDGMMVEAVVSF
jgi:hypothetical protein